MILDAFLLVAAVLLLAALYRQRRRLAAAEAESGRLREEAGRAAADAACFRETLETLPDGVVLLDAGGRIAWVNRNAADALDISPTVDLGRPVDHLLREPAFLAFLAAGVSGSTLELRGRRQAGRLLNLTLVPFPPEQRLLLVRDVSQLDRVAAMRRDFVANVSHELKTPLTVTLGFIETAQDALTDTPTEEITRYLQTAADQAGRMRRLIDDLLTLSSLETDAPPPMDEPVPLQALIAEIVTEARALSAGRHTLDVDVGRAPVLRGSSRELHSALLNLITNAVRYTPEGGEVRVTWHDQPNGAGECCVADSGIGIPPEHIGRLTERFYRVDRGRSRESGGTGLGLAIVKHVLERHGATLRISSEPGRGSVFCAVFPAQRIRR